MSLSGVPETADAIVVGAGVMGASIAFELARTSDLHVVVVIERPPVDWMSGRTFGQVRRDYSDELLVQMART